MLDQKLRDNYREAMAVIAETVCLVKSAQRDLLKGISPDKPFLQLSVSVCVCLRLKRLSYTIR